MKVHFSFLVAVAVLLGAGCASKGERSHAIEASYPISNTPYVATRIKGQPVKCPGSGDADACVIPIKINGSSCDSDNIDLADFVDLGNLATKKKIEWKLPEGYQFCPRAGDGVFLKNPNVPGTFFDLPDPDADCSQTLEWERKRSDTMDYAYLLRFRSNTEICGVKDPWMRN